jgi:hypothetical protein
MFVCILGFCAHNESCKRVYYINDRFFFRFLSGKYDNVLSDGVYPEPKKSILLRLRQYRPISYSVKNQDNYGMKV